MSVNKSKLYKIPWKMLDCPNGWIEPTTFCQLQCPLCYRGCYRSEHKPEHRNLDEMKKEVDGFIKEKNVQTISIAGGEPLLYPQLDELIKYIKSKDLSILIITNGLLLDEKRLTELKDLKVDSMLLHVDHFQNRDGIKTAKDTNALRAKYCEIFRKVGGIGLGFGMPVSHDNTADLEELLNFCRKNNDIIRWINFTTLRDLYGYEKNKRDSHSNFDEILQIVKKIYGIDYCAYIGKTVSDEISWLWGTAVFSGSNLLGSTDGNLLKIIQEDYYKNNKKYLFSSSNLKLSLTTIIKIVFNKSIIKILFKYLFLRQKGKINWQLLLVINTPQIVGNQIDMCGCCPNAMYYNNKLVPSCCYSRVADQNDHYFQTLKYYVNDYV